MEDWVDKGTQRLINRDCKYALFCGAGSPYDALVMHNNLECSSCDCREFEGVFAGYVRAAYLRRSRAIPVNVSPPTQARELLS
jgi:uncharacterized protein